MKKYSGLFSNCCSIPAYLLFVRTKCVIVFIFRHIDSSRDKFIQNLKEAVAVPSVSSIPDRRDDCIAMMKWASVQIRKLGGSVELCDVGTQVCGFSSTRDLTRNI